MTIQSAIQHGSSITIYGEHGRILGCITSAEQGDTLLGFTGSSVTVKKGSFVCVYDEHGACVSSYPA